MFSYLAITLFALSWVNAEFSVPEKEKMSVQLMDIKRSVEFGRKIAKIELEMQVFTLQNSEEGKTKEEEAKACVHAVADSVVAEQDTILDETVGKAEPEVNAAYETVMNADSATDAQWEKVSSFVKSFNIGQYRRETQGLFKQKLAEVIETLRNSMQSCLKQFPSPDQLDSDDLMDNAVAATGSFASGKPFAGGVGSRPSSSQNKVIDFFKPQARYGVAERERLSVQVTRALAGVEFGRRVGEIEAEAKLAAARAEAASKGAVEPCLAEVLAAAMAEEDSLLNPTLGQALNTLRPLADAVAHPAAASDSTWDRVSAFLRSFRADTYRVTRQRAFIARLRPWLVRQRNAMKQCVEPPMSDLNNV